MSSTTHRFNPTLKTIEFPDKRVWRGTPIDSKGRFTNLNHPFYPELSKLLRWQLTTNPDKEKKRNDMYRPSLNAEGRNFIRESNSDGIVWLGHASFFIRLGGVSMIIDPVFGDVSPGPKRLVAPLFNAEDFSTTDYILLSHDHRDHADEKSIKQLNIANPNCHYLTSLGCDNLLKQWTSSDKIQGAGWYQQYAIDAGKRVSITYLPSRHWCRRRLNDINKRLWGAFMIEYHIAPSVNYSIYFSADTGYDTHLAEVKELFGEPDICIIGVGAFKPEWFMGSAHISPSNAVKAVNEMGAKVMIPMHYGTFDLSDEPIGEPIRILEELRDNNTLSAKLLLPAIGEVIQPISMNLTESNSPA
jgi:L-ascorbate metabolism protein UlaG (beta-lactamase superfamily)